MKGRITALKTDILQLLKDEQELSRAELATRLSDRYPNLPIGTLAWALLELKQHRMVQNVTRGIYKRYISPPFQPQLSDITKQIYKGIIGRYDLDSLVIWETRWLNDFMIHQPMHSMIIVEVDKDSVESAFYFLKDQKRNEVFLRSGPTNKRDNLTNLMDAYVMESTNPIVVQSSIKRAPVQQYEGITIPAIEKMLVDVFCETILLSGYQGRELDRIYVHALKRFQVKRPILLSYADRRGKRSQLLSFLEDNVPEWRSV